MSHDFFEIVHARLFNLFIDVLCIFADDYKDFDSVVRKLTIWASLGRTSLSLKRGAPKGNHSPTRSWIELGFRHRFIDIKFTALPQCSTTPIWLHIFCFFEELLFLLPVQVDFLHFFLWHLHLNCRRAPVSTYSACSHKVVMIDVWDLAFYLGFKYMSYHQWDAISQSIKYDVYRQTFIMAWDRMQQRYLSRISFWL